jgi:hypothetical protein
MSEVVQIFPKSEREGACLIRAAAQNSALVFSCM